MTHALSSIIDLTNAPTPPRWFEFLLEPGRLQQHLNNEDCDPSPIQLINLFLKNIPSLDTTNDVAPLHLSKERCANNQQTPSNQSVNSNAATSSKSPPPNGANEWDLPDWLKITLQNPAARPDQAPNDPEAAMKVCNGATNGDNSDTTSNKNSNNNGTNNKQVGSPSSGPGTGESTDKHINDDSKYIIPAHSFEHKYRLRKTYALQTLAVKVASFLKWDLDKICNGLNIPTQYKLMQSLVAVCTHDTCPHEVEKFATVTYSHWFLKSAMTYRISTLQPQSSSTTIIYLSQLQQQQQTSDNLALMNMGELFSDVSKRLRKCYDELHAYIWDLAKNNNKDTHSTKKLKSSNHPFKKAKLSRPKMECFDSRGEQYNDWKQSEMIEPFEFIEAACYDLGRFLFFEEDYSSARDTFDIIRNSSDTYPLLDDYLKSASDILTTDDNKDGGDDNKEAESCDMLNNEVYDTRKRTEKYLFDCMTQYGQAQGLKKDESEGVVVPMEVKEAAKKDIDLRFGTQDISRQTHLALDNSWYLSVLIDQQQQQLLEIGKGDIFMSQGNFKQAIGCFVGALMLMTDYFRVFSKNYSDEEPCITRMIQCSISLSCHTQAVALCQMTKYLNYTIAFKQLNERICNDCCDDIYECIWNVTLLEYIINLHAKRGEVERRTKVIQLLGQLELNENNPDEVLREAEHVRRGRFFRIMSNKYL